MLKKEFEEWLIERMEQKAANNYISRIMTLEISYGNDIDNYYEHDKCAALLSEFEYTKSDSKMKKALLHKIYIRLGSDVYKATSNYRSYIRKYVEFRNSLSLSKTTKYQPLAEYLNQDARSSISLSYKEVEKIINDNLPERAYENQKYGSLFKQCELQSKKLVMILIMRKYQLLNKESQKD